MGTQTAALGASGRTDAPGTNTTDVEEYDGSSWTEGPNLTTARRLANSGCGTTTAGLVFGGAPPYVDTEEYNGITWSEQNNMSTGRTYLAGFGTQTAAVAATGQNTSGDEVTTTEEYNGTSWTTATAAPTATQSAAAAGILTSGLIFGGEIPPTNTPTNKAFAYDGTSWTALPDMGTAGFSATGHGTRTAALVANLRGPGGVTRTVEEFNKSATVITAGAWASGGAYPTGTFSAKMVGDKNAALGFAGYNTITTTNEYDGSSWTNVPSLPAGGGFGLGFAGTQTAGLAWHGYSGTFGSGGFNPTTAYEYNGSSWTSGGATPFQGRDSTGFGIQTAAIGAGGYTKTPAQPPTGVGVRTSNTISYDGTSWTNVNAMNTAIELLGGAGTQTAGLTFGGQNPPSLNLTEEWDGSSWTSGGTLNDGRRNLGGFGTQTAGYAVGGRNPGASGSTSTELYDGTAWVTQARLATGRSSIAVASNIAGPGQEGNTNTEEFTPETSALNLKTLTTS
jgi:hypothetical protein